MTILSVRDMSARYQAGAVTRDINLDVAPGEIVGLLGPNGAGKTTTILGIAGLVPDVSGEIKIDGAVLNGPAHRRARQGLGVVLEGRGVFASLSVADNMAAAHVDPAKVLGLFPELGRKLNLAAGSMSGGEQQMLALGIAISRDIKMLLIDELSFGLSPVACERLFVALREICQSNKLSALIVEQHLDYVASAASRAYIMVGGEIAAEMTADELVTKRDAVEALYMGEKVDPSAAL